VRLNFMSASGNVSLNRQYFVIIHQNALVITSSLFSPSRLNSSMEMRSTLLTNFFALTLMTWYAWRISRL
jgi:hypothetical protein